MKQKIRTKIEQRVLPSGIRVLAQTSKDTSFVQFSIAFAAGSKFVKNKETGLAHFLEHCIMNSTKKHTDVELSQMERDRAAKSNAMTSAHCMQFVGSCFAKDIYYMMDIMFERIFEPAFKEDETENEKKIVYQEIERRMRDKQALKHFAIQEQLYPKTHLHPDDNLGTCEGLAGVTTQDLRRYAKQRFKPSNMVVCVAGNVSIGALCKYLNGKFEKSNIKPYVIKRESEIIKEKNAFIETNVIGNNQCVISIHTTDNFVRGSKQSLAYYMLSQVLSVVGKESVLNKRIREEKQLVYGIGTGAENWGKSQYCQIFFETTKLEEVFKEINNVLSDVAIHGVDERLLMQAKESIKRNILQRNEDIYGRSPTRMAADILFGEDCSMENFQKEDDILLGLTNEDIKNAAKSLLQNNRIVIATDSNVFGKKDSRKFIKYYNKACEKIK